MSEFDLGYSNASVDTMNLLWAFSFTPAKDPNDTDGLINLGTYEVAIVPSPELDYSITTGSKHILDIVRWEFAEATSLFESFEVGLAEDNGKWVEKAGKNL